MSGEIVGVNPERGSIRLHPRIELNPRGAQFSFQRLVSGRDASLEVCVNAALAMLKRAAMTFPRVRLRAIEIGLRRHAARGLFRLDKIDSSHCVGRRYAETNCVRFGDSDFVVFARSGGRGRRLIGVATAVRIVAGAALQDQQGSQQPCPQCADTVAG
jgi:hypothetical protein